MLVECIINDDVTKNKICFESNQKSLYRYGQ